MDIKEFVTRVVLEVGGYIFNAIVVSNERFLRVFLLWIGFPVLNLNTINIAKGFYRRKPTRLVYTRTIFIYLYIYIYMYIVYTS